MYITSDRCLISSNHCWSQSCIFIIIYIWLLCFIYNITFVTIFDWRLRLVLSIMFFNTLQFLLYYYTYILMCHVIYISSFNTLNYNDIFVISGVNTSYLWIYIKLSLFLTQVHWRLGLGSSLYNVFNLQLYTHHIIYYIFTQ